ncbi:MAG: tetratricopeptide repeat protein, partial [Chthoniobacterales bacterium]
VEIPTRTRLAMFVRLLAILLTFAATAFAQENIATEPPSFEMAKRQFEAGKTSEAMATLDGVDRKMGATGKTLDLRGSIAVEQGQIDEAAKMFTAASEKEKNNLGSLHRGDLLLRQKKFAEAREVYRGGTKLTDILGIYERLRFGILLTYLAEKKDAEAQEALGEIRFPSESGAYYYAQAAWAYAHGQTRDAEKWIKRCEDIFGKKVTPWFARELYEMGWSKTKPPTSAD